MNQITVGTKVVEKLMYLVCSRHGLSIREAQVVVDNYLEAEALGKRTHGVSKFCYESAFFSQRIGSPIIRVDKGPLVKVDGNKEIGPIAAQYCVSLVAERARTYGVAIVGMNNIQRYGILRTWSEQLAREKVFGIVLNTCEPAMAGYQGTRKVLGTNPISFSLQTKEQDYIIDMATSKVAMTLIWQSLREHSPLPDNTFYDATGAVTTDPSKAKAVQNFGEVKGFSIALLIQLFCGSVFGFQMASHIKSMYDIGYVFLAVDPHATTDMNTFFCANENLLNELKNSGSCIPGSRSSTVRRPATLTLSDELFHELQQLGEKTYES